MRTNEHTRGPWRVEAGTTRIWGACDPEYTTSFGYGYPIATADISPAGSWASGPNSFEGEANARLIASAPTLAAENERLKALVAEMVEGLEPFAKVADSFIADGYVLRDSDGVYANTAGDFRNARALITRAKGTS